MVVQGVEGVEMSEDKGASLRDRAGPATPGAPAGLRHSGTIASAASSTRSARRATNRIERLRARDGDDCWICAGKIDFTLPRTSPSHQYPLSATIDHVKQRSDGGTGEDDNVRLAHKCCNHWMLARDFSRPMRGIGVRFGVDKVGHAKERVRRSLLSLAAQGGEAREGGDSEASSVHEHPVGASRCAQPPARNPAP